MRRKKRVKKNSVPFILLHKKCQAEFLELQRTQDALAPLIRPTAVFVLIFATACNHISNR
jgi:hypothetical protein